LQVCYPTTPAQYFHLLRRQVMQEIVRPLIVMTPKSLLRLPAATSTIDELTTGGFQPVIDDASITDRNAVTRVVLCSGKVYYDIAAAQSDRRQPAGDSTKSVADNVAVIRLEQFYPFPGEALKNVIAGYPNAKQFVWAQEEPQNMGGWTFVQNRINAILPASAKVDYVGRTPSASPATGSYAIHELEQKKLVDDALSVNADEISPASEPEVSEKVAPASS
jgi:2-oxoglutarate dehydrogenase E1 component